jgi:hypothetical protein
MDNAGGITMRTLVFAVVMLWCGTAAADSVSLSQLTLGCKPAGVLLLMFDVAQGSINPRVVRDYCKFFKRGEIVSVTRSDNQLCIRGAGDSECYFQVDIPNGVSVRDDGWRFPPKQ